jgi:UDP:flavonoid glycosyltransferase YjiC (YdhE family)
VVVLAAGTFGRPEGLATLLNEARATHGLPADPDLAMLDRHLVISPVPPTFRPPTPPTPATHLAMAPASPATQPAHPAVPPTHPATPAVPPSTTPAVSRAPSTTPAAPPPAHPDHPAHPAHPAVQFMRPMPLVPPAPTIPPTVYFTLGTIFNTESGDLFTRFLAGFRELPIQLIVTTGAGIDPAELGPQPANVRVERYVPQATLLPRCSAVVSHAGSGTVVGALAHGLPMVLVPMGADQPANADRCAELGLGVVLDAVDSTTADAAEALRTVLGTRGYAEAAAVLRAEIEAMPDPDEVVNRLEILVRQGR